MKPTRSSPRAITAVLSGKLILPLAPENISSIPLYHVHKNLWDTLLTEHGAPGLARLLDTAEHGRVYRFEILPEMRFSNGRNITSQDVVFSIHRLMGLQPGGHFNAKSAIEEVKVISDTRFDLVLAPIIRRFLLKSNSDMLE